MPFWLKFFSASCSVFCTAGRTARAQRRGVSAGLMACNQSRAGRREPVRKARGRGAHVHIRELLRQSLRVLLLRLQLRLPRQHGNVRDRWGGQSAGGVPCGLGWRTSVPRSFVSSADCACSILSTSTISCFTLRVATCHRQRTYADGRRRGASHELNVGTCTRSRGQARWAGLLKDGDGFAQAHI